MADLFRHELEPDAEPLVSCGVRTTTGDARSVSLRRSDVVGQRAGEVLRQTLEALNARFASAEEDGGQPEDAKMASDVRRLLLDPNCAVEIRDGAAAQRPVSDHTVIGDTQGLTFEIARDHVGG